MELNQALLKERALSYLTEDEVHSIGTMLGREPNPLEMNMFAAMWSEHISYKSSIRWLEEMPVEGTNVEVAAGKENSGVIRINDQLACVIKMESHNHPVAGIGRVRWEWGM
jgi:phosphoribosylformylglycinamidine synthase